MAFNILNNFGYIFVLLKVSEMNDFVKMIYIDLIGRILNYLGLMWHTQYLIMSQIK